MNHQWEGCPYIIHINPLRVTEGKPVPYDAIALKKQWETNMELVSKYLDCRVSAGISYYRAGIQPVYTQLFRDSI